MKSKIQIKKIQVGTEPKKSEQTFKNLIENQVKIKLLTLT